jgi:tetratricopeptide (TPR) repeat protein
MIYISLFLVKLETKALKNSYIKATLLLIFISIGCTKKRTENNFVNSSKDSLSHYFSLANDLSLTIEKRTENIAKAQEIVLEQDNDSLKRVNLFRIANRYFNIGNWKNFNKTVKLVLENSEDVGDTINIAKAYSYLGDYFDSQAIADSAFLYYYKAEKMYGKLDDNISLGKILISKANLQYKAGDFLGSEKSVFNILRIIKGEKQVNNVFYDAYNLLGITYVELGEYDNAITYHNKALAVIDDNIMPEEFQSRATSYNNLGFLYLNSRKYSTAKTYFLKGLEQKNLEIQKPFVYAMLLDNLAYSKFKLKENEGVTNLFYNSLKLREKLNLKTGVFINKIHLSEYYAYKRDTVKSSTYAKEALSLSRTTNNPHDILVALKQMAVTQPKKAAIYNKEYIQINEKLQRAERSMGDKFSRIEYETDAIKDQNSTLELQNRNLVYAFSILTILGLFIYIVKAQKTKNRELLYKQQQQKAN